MKLINVGISELVQKMAFIQYLPLTVTSLTVKRVGQKRLVDVIASAEMSIFKSYRIYVWHYQTAPNRV